MRRNTVIFISITLLSFLLFSTCDDGSSGGGGGDDDDDEDDGKIIVDISGFPENYYGVTIDAYLTSEGSTDYENALVSESLTISSAELVSITMADIDDGFESGDYDLHILLDYDGNGQYEDDTGDAVLTQTVSIGSSSGIRLDADPFAIPLLMSNSNYSRIIILDIVEDANPDDLLNITSDNRIYVELYALDESDIETTETNVSNGNYDQRYSFVSKTGSITMTLPEIDGDDGEYYMAYIYYDNDGDGVLDSGDLTEALTFITTEDADAPVIDDEDLYPYFTGMGQHEFETSDRNDDLWNNLWIEYEYTGSQVSNVQDDDDRMCFIISRTGIMDNWADFGNPSNGDIRYYANAGSFENTRILIGEDSSVDYYYIMLIDMDSSYDLSSGDYYKVSSAINAWPIDGESQSFSYSTLTEN